MTTQITLPREVVEQALAHIPATMLKETHLVREALRAALTEQVQPVQGECTPIELERWGRAENLCLRLLDRMDDGYWTPWHIATEAIKTLEQRIAALLQSNAERVPLSDEQINRLWNDSFIGADPTSGNQRFKFARAIEAEIKKGQQ